MASEIKKKVIYLQTKLQIIRECETSVASRSEIGKEYNLKPLMLFIILKDKEKNKSYSSSEKYVNRLQLHSYMMQSMLLSEQRCRNGLANFEHWV
ncbi:hypothetical protein PR048_024777 [Dryococelus australis]|uniref:HTH psq-type domain-containing protein n=1 Tax=Dryococelus australis TaxID=614101 RepID=A0ABQ9GPK7_9NEOP|nr:hypothetical protein PR048_024777 [Dryococelus australis]